MNKTYKFPKVIVITINYNQNQYTLDCIQSILKSDYPNYKVLLVDNGSEQENVKKLGEKINNKVNLQKINPNRGYVGGINYGLEEGRKLNPDYFLIMNNDTIIDSRAISVLVNTCETYNNKAIVTGKVYHYDEPKKIQDIGYACANKITLTYKRLGHNQIDQGQYDKVSERDMLDDVFWLFPTQLYNEIGEYSKYFWVNAEQADYALRAKMTGYKLVFTPYAKLWHKGSVSIGGRDYNPKLAYWNVQSSLILRFLHLKKKHFIIFYFSTIESIIRTYLKSVYLFITGKENLFRYANAKFKGWLYFNKWIFTKCENTGRNPYS